MREAGVIKILTAKYILFPQIWVSTLLLCSPDTHSKHHQTQKVVNNADVRIVHEYIYLVKVTKVNYVVKVTKVNKQTTKQIIECE